LGRFFALKRLVKFNPWVSIDQPASALIRIMVELRLAPTAVVGVAIATWQCRDSWYMRQGDFAVAFIRPMTTATHAISAASANIFFDV